MGEPPPDPLGGDHSAGPWPKTGAVGEGGPAHPDDTLRRVLQPRWWTGSPWLLDRCDEEAGVICITCQCFNWMLQFIIRAKVKCEQTLLFIAMHYWGCMSLEVKGR